ncbi:cysteine--tRNA ligase [Natranaerobius trueperi]|uniref:Cysteine--tRNA ligase n=1 Tax=Natranaerobius trueperi TaxID=759412 RepID=A0A226BZZ8_9FIRM|nr:cysteine--tRNA ligase [Natranaerobius trueperi]
MRLYNTLKRQKEEFVPLRGNEVNMYVCGPTVYDYFHVGNARAFLVFDVVRRYLEYKGYNVNYIQNITDIEDKMIKRANEKGITIFELAEEYTEKYFEDARAIGIKDADVHPRATKHLSEIINIIEELLEKGHAYQSNGDVYFDTESFDGYGQLCKQAPEDLVSGARVSVDDRKKSPTDFVLWKARKEGEPYWESPFGPGRPGWHIECSAMSMKYLNTPLDIHAGGSDLVFPHHENEIAQSEAATGDKFCKYWLHVGYLEIDNRKMSKSMGNFMTVRDFREYYDPRILRLFLLNAHYRSPLNYTEDLIDQSKSSLERLDNFYEKLKFYIDSYEEKEMSEKDTKMLDYLPVIRKEFEDSMDDDFNTAGALSALFKLVREANAYMQAQGNAKVLEKIRELLIELDLVLGILPRKDDTLLSEEIEKKIEEREQARKQKDFQKADAIRDELKEQGIILEDTPHGVRWKRA